MWKSIGIRIDSMIRKMSAFSIERTLFNLFGFGDKYYKAYKIISVDKKENRGTWLINNVAFPLIVILSPYILTIIHNHYETIDYDKSFVTLLIGGSLSLLGINVLRSSSTIISDRLKYDRVPAEFQSKISDVEGEITSLKRKLASWSWILSLIGFFLYFIQIAQLINDSNGVVYYFIAGIILTLVLSLFFGRFISLMESNLFEREEFARLLFSSLINQENDLKNLEKELTKKGLL